MRKARRHDPGITHADAMQRHTCRALWQRHGIVMTPGEYLDLCAAILIGDYTPTMRDDRGNLVYTVKFKARTFHAIWSHEHARIRTLLPCKEWVGRRFNGRSFKNKPVVELAA